MLVQRQRETEGTEKLRDHVNQKGILILLSSHALCLSLLSKFFCAVNITNPTQQGFEIAPSLCCGVAWKNKSYSSSNLMLIGLNQPESSRPTSLSNAFVSASQPSKTDLLFSVHFQKYPHLWASRPCCNTTLPNGLFLYNIHSE